MFLLFLKLYPLGMSILEQCPNNKTVQTIEYVHICKYIHYVHSFLPLQGLTLSPKKIRHLPIEQL